MKSQIVIDKLTRNIICTYVTNGKRHDFRTFKESRTHVNPDIKMETDTGYQGIKRLHANSEHPHKKRKKQKLTEEQKRFNQRLSSSRVRNEHAIGFLKRFRILSERYRNRRKRFGLRLNLICGLCNADRMG